MNATSTPRSRRMEQPAPHTLILLIKILTVLRASWKQRPPRRCKSDLLRPGIVQLHNNNDLPTPAVLLL